MKHTPERMPQLDGLRGLAALVVVISHSANAGFLPEVLGRGFGQMGVGMFYALSAFLLGHLYFGRTVTGASLHSYAVSRVSRVLPLFYGVLFLASAIFLITGFGFYDITSLKDIALNALLVQGTDVLWSIPVELQYYVVFACLWWLHSSRGYGLWPLLVLGLVVQGAVALLLRQAFPQAGTANLAYWGHLFLCGLALSQIPRTRLQTRFAPLLAVGLVALLLLALPELRRGLGIPTLPNYADPMTSGVPILILYLALRQVAPLGFLTSKGLRWLGGISFGLYLIHMPIIVIVTLLGSHFSIPGTGFAAILGVSLLLAWLARHAIELPAQAWLRAALGTRPANARAA
ncbi:acyltransferase family protein [Salipiger thiooxidans]|uniref:acyltransferase family protein n=1 Tax=Salipiger thiooxidans TaxID=282683 RepID=UPI001CFA7A56|nr:acyltransferase [Salipiger thiooxidans]